MKRERLTQATQAFHPENLEGLSGPQLEEQVKKLFGHANGGSEPVGAVASLLTIPDMNGYWPSAAACKEVADIKFLMHIIVSFVRQELNSLPIVAQQTQSLQYSDLPPLIIGQSKGWTQHWTRSCAIQALQDRGIFQTAVNGLAIDVLDTGGFPCALLRQCLEFSDFHFTDFNWVPGVQNVWIKDISCLQGTDGKNVATIIGSTIG